MRRTRQRRASALPAADLGPPERARQDLLVAHPTETPGVTGRRVKHACRLDWYLDKCSIHDRQHAAGMRFRAAWSLATARPTVTSRYAPRVSGGGDFTEACLEARRRVAAAVAALGPGLAAVAIDVCCFDEWAAGRLPLLREALTLLADHYRMPKATGP